MILGINPYLVFDGNGQEAVKFYEKALDAKVLGIQTFGEMGGNSELNIPAEAKDRILHAHLKIGNTDLMISDTFPGPHSQPHQIGSQVTIALTTANVEKSKEVFAKLSEGGQVLMPLQETFWSPLYGQVTDKFGVTWHVSTYVADHS
ncbi:PhnB protein [Caldalkalibacillus uzonensis]|uniref:PhnB protein n=1 Tax=Caldalkalibacillus uzonensis TaxID=353224 RepID=A0ABU0CND0_9BACI|nr:VOC family protein [Caldalkalibacillus uzonensis]MDQ0337399.1 PhnB protein [Caldalkalibacillus uzonensis]